MRSFVVRVVVNALAIAAATALLDGVVVRPRGGTGSTGAVVVTFLVLGLLFGVVNAVVKPVVKLLTLPITLLTLGLFTLVVNAAMLELTAWISGRTGLTLTIDAFWPTAVLAALVVSVVSLVLSTVLPDGRERRSRRD